MKRLFEIIYILLEKENVTAKELADHFEVSQRTIYRDIDSLSEAGIPIYMAKGKGGGIRLLPDFILNKAILSKEEKKEALAAIQGFTAVNESCFEDKLSKLSAFLGGNSETWIEIDFSNWSKDNTMGEKFEIIKSAVINKKIIVITYYNSNGNLLDRTVEPLKLIFKGQSWYLYAYCKEKEDFRFFKLTRIRNIKILIDGFTRTAPNKVLIDNTYENNDIVNIKLKINKNMAFRVYDEFKDYTLDEEGNYIIKTDFLLGEWLYGYIMSFGDSMEVLEPNKIREEIKERLIKTLNNY
ncbi:helix-turn-helix transcriptional regulator [Clostridium nigeriense]|uniref:helix-turn-helix transcriptional regulator n=1 Tax=Clostridium nigeriense TaxID=1805470 RepID=UPI003D345681